MRRVIGSGYPWPMHKFVPPEVVRLANDEHNEERMAGAALVIDAEGSTALSARLQPYGTEGAEALADILSAIFAPMVDRVYDQGGSVAEFGGDGILAIFPYEAAEAVARAAAAAANIMDDLAEVAEFDTPAGPANLTVRAAVGSGELQWSMWAIDEAMVSQNAVFCFSGSALDEARGGEAVTPGGVISAGPDALAHLQRTPDSHELSEGFRSISPSFEGPPLRRTASASSLPEDVRFFPESLRDATIRGEFRDVVSVFLEVDSPDGADVGQILACLAEYGGFLNQLVKPSARRDSLRALALWGAPTSREHDIGYALRFVDTLQQRVGGNRIRAGSTRSSTFAGFIGSESQDVYTAIGPGVNLAARICDDANWGELRVDQGVIGRLSEPWQWTEIDPTEYRGFSGGIVTFRVDQVPQARFEEPALGAMVGREDELDLLEDLIAPLWSGGGVSVVSVVGPPGIGKSRLLSALEGRLALRRPPPAWMYCRGDEIRTQPLETLRAGLTRHFGTPGRAESGARLYAYLEQLADQAPDHADDLARSRIALGDLFRLDSAVAEAEKLDPETRFDSLVRAIRSLLVSAAEAAPVIVAVSEAQWMDSASTEALRRVATDLEATQVAVLIETRVPEVGIEPDAVVELGPLDSTDLEELVQLTTGESAPRELLETIAERSGGNPFHAIQLLEYLQRSDYELGSFDPKADVTLEMRRILVARLDALPPSVRLLVQTAAVVGSVIDLGVLFVMTGRRADFRTLVDEAVETGVLRYGHDDRVMFADLLVKDAAYGMLLHSDARRLHSAAADAIAQAAPEDSRYGELAFHYDRARNWERAAHFYLEAGRHAADGYDNVGALGDLDRALELFELIESGDVSSAVRAKHDVFDVIGDRVKQEETIDALDEIAGNDAALKLEVSLLRVGLLISLGRYEEAESIIDGAPLETTDAEHNIQRGSLLFQEARVARLRGRIDEAKALVEDALVVFVDIGDEARIAAALDLAGGIAWEEGDFSEAVEFHRMAAEKFNAQGMAIEEIGSLNNLGSALFALGDYSAAGDIHRNGAERSRSIGYLMGEGDHLDNLGGTHWAMWQLEEALGRYEAALAIRERISDDWGMAISTGNIGSTRRAMGDAEAGLALYRRALEIDQKMGRRRGEAYDLHGIGLCHLDLGRLNLAVEELARSAEIRSDLGEDHLAHESKAACALAMLRRGDTEQATELVNEVLEEEGDEFFAWAVETTASRLRCIEVLDVSDPGRARSLRQRTLQRVTERTEAISDPVQREQFLQRLQERFGVDVTQ